MNKQKLTIHADGLCEPNPGKASWAFIVFDESAEVIHEGNGFLGNGKTNNFAEYVAVGKAAAWCLESAKSDDIELFSDSMLVVNQVNGDWRCSETLEPLRNRVRELFAAHGKISLGWVKGTENQADGLTRSAYEAATGIYPQPRIKKAA